MVNRILIRIKVLQTLFAFYKNNNGDLKTSEKELLFSLQKSYDLYILSLLLITQLTSYRKKLIDKRKNKLSPTPEDLNPDMRMVNNRLAAQLEINETLWKVCADRKVSWEDDSDFIKKIYNKIVESSYYLDYLTSEEDNYEIDRKFWVTVFKKLILNNEDVDEFFEEKSIYWNDDINIVQSFVIKTLKKFEEENKGKQEILPMFKDMEDKAFAVKLFRQSLLTSKETKETINKHIKNWESERVAQMDLLIMQIAITEIITFTSIPTRVSLNEYINLAKCYSTPKSGKFINGILDSIVKELKSNGVITE